MEGQARTFAAGDSADYRSFAVEAFVGRRVGSWPFARFDVSSHELRVRIGFPWFTTRAQQAAAIRAVTVVRRFGDLWWLRFDDATGGFSDVRLHLVYRRKLVIEELRRSGYHVIDETARAVPRWHWRRN